MVRPQGAMPVVGGRGARRLRRKSFYIRSELSRAWRGGGPFPSRAGLSSPVDGLPRGKSWSWEPQTRSLSPGRPAAALCKATYHAAGGEVFHCRVRSGAPPLGKGVGGLRCLLSRMRVYERQESKVDGSSCIKALRGVWSERLDGREVLRCGLCGGRTCRQRLWARHG